MHRSRTAATPEAAERAPLATVAGRAPVAARLPRSTIALPREALLRRRAGLCPAFAPPRPRTVAGRIWACTGDMLADLIGRRAASRYERVWGHTGDVGAGFTGRQAASRYVAGWSSSVSSLSSSAHHRLFDRPPKHPRKNGAAVSESEEIGAFDNTMTRPPSMAATFHASSPNSGGDQALRLGPSAEAVEPGVCGDVLCTAAAASTSGRWPATAEAGGYNDMAWTVVKLWL
jgi:hypothetical protein